LHQHDLIDPQMVQAVFPHLVHVHYHWLLAEQSLRNPLFSATGPLAPSQREWLLAASADGRFGK
jgi:hypothetical protein